MRIVCATAAAVLVAVLLRPPTPLYALEQTVEAYRGVRFIHIQIEPPAEGVPADKMQEVFGKLNVVRIVSIGQPAPHPMPGVGGFVVPCQVEVEKDGTRSIQTFEPGIRPVYKQPDRWDIHGGI